jgi:hypothetical protein
MGSPRRRGLFLGITNLNQQRLASDCRRVIEPTRRDVRPTAQPCPLPGHVQRR